MTGGGNGGGRLDDLDELADLLDRERHLLENLVFRLVEVRNLLVSGEARFLGWAAADVEDAAAAVRDVESRRAASSAALGVGCVPTMSGLVEVAAEPWSTLLAEHRDALGRLAAEVAAAIETAHDLAAAGLEQVHVAGGTGVDLTAGEPVGKHLGARSARLRRTCDLRDRATSTQARRALPLAELDELDREITAAGYAAVLTATARMGLPGLVAFLR